MEINAIARVNPAITVDTPVNSQERAARAEIVAAVNAINEAGLLGDNRELMFARDRETNRSVIRIVDKKTREVIDQIPPESVIRLADAL